MGDQLSESKHQKLVQIVEKTVTISKDNLKAQSCITPELVFTTSLLANQQARKRTSYKKLYKLFNELVFNDHRTTIKIQQHYNIDNEDHKEYNSKFYGIGHYCTNN
jgi:hypothetical protein